MKKQSEVQQKQSDDINVLSLKMVEIEKQSQGKYIKTMIDVATDVSMLRLEDKIKEGKEELHSMHLFPHDKMNGTISRKGLESRKQRDEVKALVASLDKRLFEMTKDSNRIQNTVTSVRIAMEELEILEIKLIDMMDHPDPITDSRIKHLESIIEETELTLSRTEFFMYLEQFRMDRDEVVAKVIEDGIKESQSKGQWAFGLEDIRNRDPTYRRLETAKRNASIRATSETVSARIRAYSEDSARGL